MSSPLKRHPRSRSAIAGVVSLNARPGIAPGIAAIVMDAMVFGVFVNVGAEIILGLFLAVAHGMHSSQWNENVSNGTDFTDCCFYQKNVVKSSSSLSLPFL